MKHQLLIFDFDGTIADSGMKVFEIMNNMAPDYGVERATNRAQVDRLRNMPPRQVLKELNISIYKVPSIIARIRKELSLAIPNLKTFKGIPEVLSQFKKEDRKMGLISSNSKENLLAFLKNNKIDDFFDFVEGGNSMFGKHRKIKSNVKRERVSSDHAVYIGDEYRDIEAARKSKVEIASVTWGFSTKGLLEKGKPDYLIDEPKDLLLL